MSSDAPKHVLRNKNFKSSVFNSIPIYLYYTFVISLSYLQIIYIILYVFQRNVIIKCRTSYNSKLLNRWKEHNLNLMVTLFPLCYAIQPFKPSRCIKASFYILKNRLNFPTTKGFSTKISMKLVCQYMVIFFNFKPHQIIFHPLEVKGWNYSYLFNFRPNMYISLCLNTHFILYHF